ncbi:hypothetical protein CgunFtcFv8_016369 [Champsocephalus gunnari]|uniref:Uncharacterized protein n=1 Tax=Champsocephalus gunnari TaxID=52237 RepID=A0AAN8CQY8_CHAGU|nr:hypothetical protein CgunFtcFv8_016369 [Champsocephalus gunnari]
MPARAGVVDSLLGVFQPEAGRADLVHTVCRCVANKGAASPKPHGCDDLRETNILLILLRAHKKKWIKPSSLSAVKLEKLVTDKRLCKDIGKLSAVHQTSNVEGFHSLIIQFAPKCYVYSYTGMLCRTLLARLHYNENASRHTATTKAGEQRFKIRYPKYKAGGHVVKKILVEATFSYVDDLMREVVDLCKKPSADRPVQLEEPPTLSSAMEKPDKAEAIKAHASRFKTK